MEQTTTDAIVSSLTRAIVERRLTPGAKLAEQKLADHFHVSRTVVRQALFQLSQNRLIRMEPARGAFVAAPSVEEARQVFAVRRMLELAMIRELAERITPAEVQALRAHLASERQAISQEDDVPARTALLGDFHVLMARMLKNEVLAQMLGELISRCSLITLMYQSGSEAQDSTDGHEAIVDALARNDCGTAERLTLDHLLQVEASLTYDRKGPTHDIAIALA